MLSAFKIACTSATGSVGCSPEIKKKRFATY
jgi:hypothetical protein